VDRAERLDTALGMDLRHRRTDELPRAVLASPSLPRRRSGWQATASVLAVGATLTVAAIASGIALNPPASASPGPVGVTSEGPTASAGASVSPPSGAVALLPGRIAAVVNEPDTDVPLVVRTDPGTTDPSTITAERLHTGQRVRLLDGPVEANGYPWYEVSVGEVTGWVAAEAKDGASPWLDTVANGEILYTAGPLWAGELATIDPGTGEGGDFLAGPLAPVALSAISCQALPSAMWAPGGRSVIVVDGDVCADALVYRVNADGTDARPLGASLNPAITGDGERVALPPVVDGDLDARRLRIQVSATDGNALPEELLPSPDAFAPRDAAWSPDGKVLAFSGFATDDPTAQLRADGGSIYLHDGTALRFLTHGYGVSWSPDGHWLVFGRPDGDEMNAQLYRIRPDGSDEERLGPGNPDSVAFAPAGDRLAFDAIAEAPDVLIATFAAPYRDVVTLGAGVGPTWSPDGEWLAWARYRGDEAPELRVARADGSDARTVALGSGPSWRPIIGQAESP
jgi:hypothetical protein